MTNKLKEYKSYWNNLNLMYHYFYYKDTDSFIRFEDKFKYYDDNGDILCYCYFNNNLEEGEYLDYEY